MKLVVQEAPHLRSAIDSIACLVEEGEFQIKKDGLYFKAMDPSQIAMVSFKMPKEAFVEYAIPEENTIGVDVDQLSKVLARGKSGEKAELSLKEGRLVISFVGENHKRTFKVPLIETRGGSQQEPNIEFKNKSKISSKALKEALKDAGLVSSHATFKLTQNEFGVNVEGDKGDMNAEFGEGSEGVLDIQTNGSSEATFPLQYLDDMIKSASSVVKLNLETDKPLKIEYEVEGAEVVYYLAPRIERE